MEYVKKEDNKGEDDKEEDSVCVLEAFLVSQVCLLLNVYNLNRSWQRRILVEVYDSYMLCWFWDSGVYVPFVSLSQAFQFLIMIVPSSPAFWLLLQHTWPAG